MDYVTTIKLPDLLLYTSWFFGAIGFVGVIWNFIIKPTRENKRLNLKLREARTTLSEIRSTLNKEKRITDYYGKIIKDISIHLSSAYESDALDKEKLYALIVLCATAVRHVESNEANYKEL